MQQSGVLGSNDINKRSGDGLNELKEREQFYKVTISDADLDKLT